MRLLHTADWHFGKTLEGKDRQAEQEQFVDELCAIVERERIDVVLVAGDVYQSVNPTAAAEELFYEALDRLADNGRRAIVIIAGNHDSPERLCAATPLAERHGITLVGLPKDPIRPTEHGAINRVSRVAAGPAWVELVVPKVDHAAVIATLPFPSESRLSELLSVTADEGMLRERYSARVGAIFEELGKHYRVDTVNIAMTHLYAAGGAESASERQIQLGGAYAVEPAHFPREAQYVALGHLHRPQWVPGAPTLTRYAGSPLAYSFSEEGHTKSVMIVEALPGQPVVAREIPLTAGRPLVKWRAVNGLQDVYRWVDEGRDKQSWIDLELHLTEALSIVEAQTLRTLHPGLVHIRPTFAPQEKEASLAETVNVPIEELFVRFYERQQGGAKPSDALVALFRELVTDRSEDEGNHLSEGEDGQALQTRAEDVAG